MANIFRLIAFVFCFLFSAFSYALVPKAATYTPSDYSLGSFSTPDAACSAILAFVNNAWAPSKTTGSLTKCEESAAYIYRSSGTSYIFGITKSLACPANSVQSGTQCMCNAGFEEKNGQCVKPDTGDKKCEDLAIIWNSTLTPDRSGRAPGTLAEFADGKLVCHDPGPDSGLPAGQGCKHKFTGDLGFQDGQGKWFVNGWSQAYDSSEKASLGGTLACSLTDPNTPKEEDQPKDCRNGYKGTVNGIEVCVEAWTGKTEGVDWTRVNDAEGNESDLKTKVTCSGDQCTLTQEKTTKKPDGTTTTTTTNTENVNRQAYCARNPKSSICGREEDNSSTTKGQDGKGGDGDGEGEEEKSSFGGSCAASFTCEGDAIQCAIAKEQHIRACKLFEDKSPESDLYAAEKNKEGDRTKDLPGNETMDMRGRIDTTDALGGGGSGVQDLNLTVAGHSVTLPLSNLNNPLQALGSILVAVSFLIAVRIIGRG